MADIVLTGSDLQLAAITFNAAILLSMGLAMLFAKQINAFGSKLSDKSKGFMFLPLENKGSSA